MQLVIDIPNEVYSHVIDVENRLLTPDEEIVLRDSVVNGTPLPKGHGRLIDADELKKHKYHDNHRYENAVAVAQIDWADTIIEADKEG